MHIEYIPYHKNAVERRYHRCAYIQIKFLYMSVEDCEHNNSGYFKKGLTLLNLDIQNHAMYVTISRCSNGIRYFGSPCTNDIDCQPDLSLVVRKPVFGSFDQVPHEPGCTATEDG